MIYRMKQNAVGLANICIMSTMVLVMISTTVSMFIGRNDFVRTMYPYDMSIDYYYSDEDEFSLEAYQQDVVDALKKSNIAYEHYIAMEYFSVAVRLNNSTFVYNDNNFAGMHFSDFAMVTFLTLYTYNSLTNQSATLLATEIIVYSSQTLSGFNYFEQTYQIKAHHLVALPDFATSRQRSV